MPTPGLSLVGFLDQQSAVNLFRSSCVVNGADDASLEAAWREAKARLGAPMTNAGNPSILPIPADGHSHMSLLVQQPWLQHALQGNMVGATFQMVELDPLLAFQFNVDIARSDHHNGGPDATPSTADIFNMCLPLTQVVENVSVAQNPNSLLINSRGLNFQQLAQGVMTNQAGTFVGLQVGLGLPLLHVVRYNGRCYLHNGFHRAVGLSRRGIKYAPCVFRDVPDPLSAGIRPGLTFDVALLESADPPTVGHFALDRAYEVQLKVFSRTLHVSWADYITTQD